MCEALSETWLVNSMCLVISWWDCYPCSLRKYRVMEIDLVRARQMRALGSWSLLPRWRGIHVCSAVLSQTLDTRVTFKIGESSGVITLNVSVLQRQFIFQTWETGEIYRNAIFINLVFTECYTPYCLVYHISFLLRHDPAQDFTTWILRKPTTGALSGGLPAWQL